MKTNPQKIYIGVAWPYVNGDIHIGHLTYLLSSDLCSRYHRLHGDDVIMISGSDCHGTPTTVQADKEKVTPQEIVDRYHPERLRLMRTYDITYSLYTKTHTENHTKVVQDIFLKLLKNGFIEKGTCMQYYSKKEDMFLPDRYVEGECPHCHSKEQRSDQCEGCGRMLDQGELINPVSKTTGSKVTLKESEQYFFMFNKLATQLKKHTKSYDENYRKWIHSESMGWINEGLQKRAITRDLDWGVPLPIDRIPEKYKLNSFDGKCFYVWFEAVIGYLSGSIEWSRRMGGEKLHQDIIFTKNIGQKNEWKELWFNQNAIHYYFMGQDNLVFHTLMWPAILLGTNEDYKLPDNIVVNKFYNYEGRKFSKSRNWIIDSMDIAEQFGTDVVRYHIYKTLPENKEGNFKWKEFENNVNSDLVGKTGNLIHRVLTFINSKFGGQINKTELNKDVEKSIKNCYQKCSSEIENTEYVKSLHTVIRLVEFGNQYFDKSKVWEVIKDDKEKAEEILYNCLVIIANLRTLFNPYMPQFSKKIEELITIEPIEYEVNKNYWAILKLNKPTITISKNPTPIFNKIEYTK